MLICRHTADVLVSSVTPVYRDKAWARTARRRRWAGCDQFMSSFIVLGIVAIWILVLVPMWLNRHDSDSASRSMDSFSAAMRVLSRHPAARTSRGDRRYLVLPRDDWGVTVDNESDTSTGRRPRALRLPALRLRRDPYARRLSGRGRVIARRRRIALLFAVLTIGLAVSAVVFHTSWWFELGAGVALALYVIHLRTDAIRAAEMRRRRLVRTAREAAPRMSSRASGEYRYAARTREVLVDVEESVAVVGAASASGTENGSRWEPVAVPLPTYVSKPVVSRPAAAAPKADAESGTIDLTRPGAWIDSQVDVRHLLDDDDELDAIIQRRRAVND
jgi:hypothetical protein